MTDASNKIREAFMELGPVEGLAAVRHVLIHLSKLEPTAVEAIRFNPAIEHVEEAIKSLGSRS